MGMEGGEVCLLVGFGTLGSRYSSLKRRRMSACVCLCVCTFACKCVCVCECSKFGLILCNFQAKIISILRPQLSQAIPKSISTPSLIPTVSHFLTVQVSLEGYR